MTAVSAIDHRVGCDLESVFAITLQIFGRSREFAHHRDQLLLRRKMSLRTNSFDTAARAKPSARSVHQRNRKHRRDDPSSKRAAHT